MKDTSSGRSLSTKWRGPQAAINSTNILRSSGLRSAGGLRRSGLQSTERTERAADDFHGMMGPKKSGQLAQKSCPTCPTAIGLLFVTSPPSSVRPLARRLMIGINHHRLAGALAQ